jgi:hypothetical protein
MNSASITECGDNCKAIAEDVANEGNDYCCTSTTTKGTNPNFSCSLYFLATVPGANIKKAESGLMDSTFDAWAWNAGVVYADMTVAKEEPAAEAVASGSTMISFAIATIASIAMTAY